MRIFPKDRDLNEAPEAVDLVVESSVLGQPARGFLVRLDHYLASVLTWRSRTSIQELIRGGWVSTDPATAEHPRGAGRFGVERRPGRKLKHRSRIRIEIPPEHRLEMSRPGSAELRVLYEDERVVAVDKPPFLPVHPAGRHVSGTLIQRVYELFPASPDRSGRPRLCHRLDRETSGIVLVGKDPEAHSACMRQFEERRVEKEYLAIVEGVPALDAGTIDLPIGPARGSAIGLKMAATPAGLPSRTDWSVVERSGDVTLVRCRLHTGRTHQIRVHLAAIGHPVVGDKLYGPDEALFEKSLEEGLDARDLELLRLPRQALHHHRLVFRSPAAPHPVEVKSPLAADLRNWLDARHEPPPRTAHTGTGARKEQPRAVPPCR